MFAKIDKVSLMVMGITLFLFSGSVVTKGLTHNIMLESGVFLISVKLILMAFRNREISNAILKELAELKKLVAEISRDRQ
jgi:hypothetical protein